ncbi:MAG: hypothetical protein ABIW76_10845 [Fibrobacteria bacterium]
MKIPASGRNRSRSALAGIANFFRQLSLFDPVHDPTIGDGPVTGTSGTDKGSKGQSGEAKIPRPAFPIADSPPTSANPKPRLEPLLAGAANPFSKPSGAAVESASPGFADLCRGPYAHIQVVTRKRLWESWRVAWTRRNESLRVDIPLILEVAPLEVKHGVLEWAVLVTRQRSRRDPAIRLRRAELEALIREHLRAPEILPGNPGPGKAAKLRLARNHLRIQNLVPAGMHHHLDEAFRAINARYFDNRLQARLTWSARLGGLSTHSVSQDGDGAAYHLISISRGYDSPEVTSEILGGVVYHECLHIDIPPRREGGRRVVHGPDFRRREREYEHFEIWRRWHREGLPKALRRLKRG